MTDMDQRELPLQSESSWNEWRAENPGPYSFRGLQLQGANLSYYNLSQVDFSGANLQGSLLEGCLLDGAVFSGADLRNADLSSARLKSTIFKGARLERAILIAAEISMCDFEGAQLVKVRLTGAKVSRTIFRHTRLEGAWLNSARLLAVDLSQCNLQDANLSHLVVEDSSFSEVNLTQTNLEMARCSKVTFDRCQLDHARMRDAAFSKAEFHGIRFAASQVEDVARVTFVDTRFILCDFKDIPLFYVTFSSCKATDCSWPIPQVGMSRTGALLDAPSVMQSAVEEVTGLPELQRREIRRVQVLRALWISARNKGRLSTLLFRLWGIVSGYGQSINRWALASLLVVLLFTPLWYFLDDRTSQCLTGAVQMPIPQRPSVVTICDNPPKLGVLNALTLSAAEFITLGSAGPVQTQTLLTQAILILESLAGLLMAGTLVSIFTNALSKV